MCSVLKNEFKLSNLWLNYNKPEAFYKSQWRFPWPVFVIYRLAVAAYALFVFVRVMVVWMDGAGTNFKLQYHVMVYITTWSYLVLALHLVLAAITSIWCLRGTKSRLQSETVVPNPKGKKSPASSRSNRMIGPEPNDCDVNSTVCDKTENKPVTSKRPSLTINKTDDVLQDNTRLPHVQHSHVITENRLPWYLKLAWVLWNIVFVHAIFVTVVYFGVIYERVQKRLGYPGIQFDDLNIHGINTVFVILDTVIGAMPVRLLHVIYPAMYGIVYIVFSVIFWSVDHSNVIYRILLDWNNADVTIGVVILISVVIVPVLQCFHFALYRLRLFAYKQIYKEDY